MATNQFGIDLKEIYSGIEDIKGKRTNNALASLQLGEAERMIKERPEKERLALERKKLLTGLREKAVGGDTDAEEQLLAIDPQGGADFLNAVSKMDERKLEATQRSVDEMGQIAGYILQGQTPEEQARRFDVAKGGMSPEMGAKLGEVYDPQFMELSLSKAMSMDKILERMKPAKKGKLNVLKYGDEDVMTQDGSEISRTDTAIKPTAGGGAGGMKAADESLMYKQSVEVLGGIFDQAGNITNLDPAIRNKIQGITTEATKVFRGGGVTRSEAVKIAAKKFGVNVPDVPEGDPNDPNSIRNYLLK